MISSFHCKRPESTIGKDEERVTKILVTDDVKDDVESLCRILNQHGYETLKVYEASKVLDVARRHQPDLIVMDVLMANGDGVTICKSLLDDDATKEIPIIVVTALQEIESLRKSLDIGAFNYVKKPFDDVELLAWIRSALRFKKRQDELIMAKQELEAKNKELQKLAVTDGLTGLYIRSHFLHLLAQELMKAQRYGRNLSMFMVDIDFFKDINDQHGHLAGDFVLRELSGLLTGNLRKVDIVGRYGGEEFSVGLPETGREQALYIAERLRNDVESKDFLFEQTGIRIKVTISIGISCYPSPKVKKLTDMIEIADHHLYRAKRGGRNRVCS
jgi:two-component system cell cycle response regulator